MRTRLACLALLILLHCGSAGADDGPMPAPAKDVQAWFVLQPSFETLDCTDEGYIHAAEVDEHLLTLRQDFAMALVYHSRLSAHDAAGLGRLKAISDYVSAAMDSNGDGVIAPLEYRDYVIELIAAADDDGDGEVTPEELIVEAF